MIDIHSHLIPFIDDGSPAEEISIEMVKNLTGQGVTDIILTPHYKKNLQKDKAEILSAFESFKDLIKSNGITVNLYIGSEVCYREGIFNNGGQDKFLTLNGTDYVLIEFENSNALLAQDAVYELKAFNFKPIIAHAERYSFLKIKDVKALKEMGALIQVNSDAVCGKVSCRQKRVVKKLLKLRLVDFVASDCHFFRQSSMIDAYKIIFTKYGKDYADELFYNNGKKIIEGK